MSEAKVLGAQIFINDYELIKLPLDIIKEKIDRELTYAMAKELMNTGTVTITETPIFAHGSMSKQIRAEVMVMDKKEYTRLKRIEALVEKLEKELLNQRKSF